MEYVTLKEASKLTGKSVHTIRKLIKTKGIATKKELRGKRPYLLISKSDLSSHYKFNNHNHGVGNGHNYGYDNGSDDKKYNSLYEALKNQLEKKDKQIEQLHVMLHESQKNNIKLDQQILLISGGGIENKSENLVPEGSRKKSGFWKWF